MYATSFDHDVGTGEAAFTCCIGFIPIIGFCVCLCVAFIEWPRFDMKPVIRFKRHD